MKQSPLKRRSKPRRSQSEREAMEAFKSSVSWPCASCGRWPGYEPEAHHVVYRQACPPGMEWDTRNALAVCVLCHRRHHDGSDFKIPMSVLTEQNLAFAREVRGAGWEDYLFAHYRSSIEIKRPGDASTPPARPKGMRSR